MPSKYTKVRKKKTNNKKVPNYSWIPSADQYQPPYIYHREFPIEPEVTQSHLGIVLNKKLKTPIPLKNTYVVICKYNQCKDTWGQWRQRRPFYSFNTNHHRKVHGHNEYKLQIVSRLLMSKYKYKQEYGLTETQPTIADIYSYKIPSVSISIYQRS